MKYLLHRLTALLLAVLLLCSAGSALVLAALERFDPACVLGTEPSDMLAAGGRRARQGTVSSTSTTPTARSMPWAAPGS